MSARQRVTLELVHGQVFAMERGQDVVALITLASGEEVEVELSLLSDEEAERRDTTVEGEPDEDDQYWSGTGEAMNDDSYIDYLNNQ